MTDRNVSSRLAPVRVAGGAVLAALLLLLGRAVISTREQPATARAGMEPAAVPAVAVGSVGAPEAGAGSTFTVPRPGDPEYADYQAMLADPHYRSSLENTAGYALPYDPEWRSVVRGRREVGPTNLQFHRGLVSLEALATSYLEGLGSQDVDMLFDLGVTPQEFKGILWPEFPQSRPFLRIPADEAWLFQLTHMNDDLASLYGRLGGVDRELVSVKVGSAMEFTNFRLLNDVTITAHEVDTGKIVTLHLDAVAERNGRYKVYTFGKS